MTCQLNILFCVNEAFAQHAAVTIASTISNTKAPLRLLIIGKLSDDTRRKIVKTSTIRRHVAVDFMNPVAELFNEKFPIRSHLSFDAYVRLWVADFYSEEVTRVLYLDADIIVVGDIVELFNIDLGDAVLGAVPIPWYDRNNLPGYKREYGYFNSGVLLFNIARWRESNAHERVVEYIVEYRDIIRDADQDSLNACLFNEKYNLPLEWNVMNAYFRGQPIGHLSAAEVDRIGMAAKAIHFAGSSKPWHYMSNHPKKELYYEYISMTPWAKYTPPDRTLFNIIMKNLADIMPSPLKRKLKFVVGAAENK